MDTRRTRPGYLSEGEAETERRRTGEMVRGFLIRKQVTNITNIGETNNFVVDYDRHERLLIIYGKETPKECPFKLAFNESETTAIMDLLVKAKAFFCGNQT